MTQARSTTVRTAGRRAPEPGAKLESLSDVFRRHHGRVFAAAYRVTGNAMDAEDVLQTVFVRLLRREPDGPGPDASADDEAWVAYLSRSAVNGALDILRRRSRRGDEPLDEGVALPGKEVEPVDPDHALVRARVRAALARMSPRSAEMFALKYFEGFSHREIGELHGTTESVVGVTLYRARRRLRDELTDMMEEEE